MSPDVNDVIRHLADQIRQLSVDLAVARAHIQALQQSAQEDDDA